ncbi:MAG: hypothetical protein JST20_10470 [Bacteroidetes bacterium]|nr:hypothetical protein [Bacteroidota bacterium]
MKPNKNDILFSIGLLCAVWFACTGIIWVYYLALFISYPVGVISFLMWKLIKSEQRKRTRFIPIILAVGMILSLTVLVLLLLSN